MKTRNFLYISIFIAILISGFTFSSCNKIKELASVDVTYNLPRINFRYVPTTVKSGEVILYDGFVHINVDSLMDAYGISTGEVTDPQFTQFVINIDTPPEANFGWMQTARAIVADNSGFSGALEIARAQNNGGTNRSVTCTINNNNIPLGSTGFYLRVYSTLTGPIPYEWIDMYINSQIQMTFTAI